MKCWSTVVVAVFLAAVCVRASLHSVDTNADRAELAPVAATQEVLVVHICDHVPSAPHADTVMGLLELLVSMEHSVSIVGRGYCFHANRKRYTQFISSRVHVHVAKTPSLHSIQEDLLDKSPFIHTVIFIAEETYTKAPAVDFFVPVLRSALPEAQIVYYTPGLNAAPVSKASSILRLNKDVLDSDGMLSASIPPSDEITKKEQSLISHDALSFVAASNRAVARDILSYQNSARTRIVPPALPQNVFRALSSSSSASSKLSAFYSNETAPCNILGLADQRSFWDRLAWRRFAVNVWPRLPASCSLTIGFLDEALASVEQLFGPKIAASLDASRIRMVPRILGKSKRSILRNMTVFMDPDNLSPASRFRDVYVLARRIPAIVSPVAFEKLVSMDSAVAASSVAQLVDRSDAAVPILVADAPDQWRSRLQDLMETSLSDRKAIAERLQKYARQSLSPTRSYNQWSYFFNSD
eukprot:ANDGO_02518.mRNA.1 hypothetical protein